MKDKTLIGDGSSGQLTYIIHEANDSIAVKTIFIDRDKRPKFWTPEEIFELLNEGMKFRLLKKANEIEEELINHKEED